MTYQFKIQIKGITKPPVWRRVLVPDIYTFCGFTRSSSVLSIGMIVICLNL